jgi:hypothetical protein
MQKKGMVSKPSLGGKYGLWLRPTLFVDAIFIYRDFARGNLPQGGNDYFVVGLYVRPGALQELTRPLSRYANERKAARNILYAILYGNSSHNKNLLLFAGCVPDGVRGPATVQIPRLV